MLYAYRIILRPALGKIIIIKGGSNDLEWLKTFLSLMLPAYIYKKVNSALDAMLDVKGSWPDGLCGKYHVSVHMLRDRIVDTTILNV